MRPGNTIEGICVISRLGRTICDWQKPLLLNLPIIQSGLYPLLSLRFLCWTWHHEAKGELFLFVPSHLLRILEARWSKVKEAVRAVSFCKALVSGGRALICR